LVVLILHKPGNKSKKMFRAVRAVAPRVLKQQGAFVAQQRCVAKPAWVKDSLVKVYESNFETEVYPEEVVAGEHVTFAKLLFKFGQVEKAEDKYVTDLTTNFAAAKAKAGAFWNDKDIGTDAAFAGLSDGVRFTLAWMQKSQQLEKLESVTDIFKLYVASSRKSIEASVTLYGPDKAKNSAAAKDAATKLMEVYFTSKKGWKLNIVEVNSGGSINGFRVNVGGMTFEDVDAIKAASAAGAEADLTECTTVPVAKFRATVWPDNIESEVLSQWCSDLSAYDAEEARYGA